MNVETHETENNTTTSENNATPTEQEEIKKAWYLNWQTWLKIFILLVVITFLVLAIIFGETTLRILTGFLDWMQQNAAAGSFAFIGLYWFCTVMFIPGSVLTLGAGFVFRAVAGPIAGIFLATIIVFAGASLGASTAFLLGRFVFREKVASYKSKYEKFDIIDKVVEEQGLKVTILLRLSPIIPFSAFNYFMGLTGVAFRDYNIAHFGMLPGTLAYCFIGGTLGAIGDSVGFTDPLILSLTIGGTILAIIGMIYISYVAKKEFAKIAEQQQMSDGNVDLENSLETATTGSDGVENKDGKASDDTLDDNKLNNNVENEPPVYQVDGNEES